jgi:hypothetical protein
LRHELTHFLNTKAGKWFEGKDHLPHRLVREYSANEAALRRIVPNGPTRRIEAAAFSGIQEVLTHPIAYSAAAVGAAGTAGVSLMTNKKTKSKQDMSKSAYLMEKIAWAVQEISSCPN